MDATVTIPLEPLDTDDVPEPILKGDASNGVASGTDETKVDVVLQKEGLQQLLDAINETDCLVHFASAFNENKQLDSEHATQISTRLETILEKNLQKREVLLLTLQFVIPRPTLFYLSVEIMHLYTLSCSLESLSNIIVANELFMQKAVDLKSLSDAECLCLLKAVPTPLHSLGWVCLLNAVSEEVFVAALPTIVDQLVNTSFRDACPKLLSMASSTSKSTASARVIAIAVAVEKKRSTGNPVDQVLLELLQRPDATRTSIQYALEAILSFSPQPLKMEYDQCAVELSAKRGPPFTELTVYLFEWSCSEYNLNALEMLTSLVKRNHINDKALSIIVEAQKSELDDVLSLAVLCAANDYVLTSLVIAKNFQIDLEELFMSVITESEEAGILLLKNFKLNPYSVHCTRSSDGYNALHIAAENGFADLTKKILDTGFTCLLWVEDITGHYPVEIALENHHYQTASLMIRQMDDRTLCLSTDKQLNPRVRFQKLLFALIKSDKKGAESDNIQDCINAILDTTMIEDDKIAYHDVLEADENGHTPDSPAFNEKSQSSTEIIGKHNLEETANHNSFRALISYRWKKYGWKLLGFRFIAYLVYVLIYDSALIVATEARHPHQLDTHVHAIRLSFTIIAWILATFDILLQVWSFVVIYRLNLKRYLLVWTSWIDGLAAAAIFLTFPVHFSGRQAAWAIAALAFLLQYLRMFQYFVIFRPLFIYVKILVKVIYRDLVQFLLVFAMTIIAFGGALYLVLRGEPCTIHQTQHRFSPHVNTSLCLHPDETGSFGLTILTGIRLLVEGGGVIDPYIFGAKGFKWLGVIVYIVYLFVVSIVLLNLLIAQFSNTYTEELDNARISIRLERAVVLHRIHSAVWVWGLYQMVWLCCKKKISLLNYRVYFYRKSSQFKRKRETTSDESGGNASSDDTQMKLNALQKQLEMQAEAIANLTSFLKQQLPAATVQSQVKTS